jgi:ABC-type lipoprotein release transport system permease subunit
MLATANDSFGAFFIAYDPTQETEYTLEWTDGLIAGELFDAPDSDGIILGRVLADNLEAELGDKVVYTLTDRSGEIVSGMERLSGIITTGADSTDAAIVLMPIDTVRDVVGYEPNESTQVAIFLNNGRRTLTVSERLDKLVGADAAVLTWDELQPEIKTFIAMKKGGGAVMSIVIAILVAAGIFNTIFMSVMERIREFGIMVAVGYSPGQIFGLVMAESSIFAVLGLTLSAAFTAPLYLYLNKNGLDMTATYREMGMTSMDISGIGFDPVMPFGVFPENMIAIAAAMVLATMLAGLYPAWKAGRVEPVESINLV